MALEKTKFNAYMEPKYSYVKEQKLSDEIDPISVLVFELYQFLIKNGTSDKKKKMLNELKQSVAELETIKG